MDLPAQLAGFYRGTANPAFDLTPGLSRSMIEGAAGRVGMSPDKRTEERFGRKKCYETYFAEAKALGARRVAEPQDRVPWGGLR